MILQERCRTESTFIFLLTGSMTESFRAKNYELLTPGNLVWINTTSIWRDYQWCKCSFKDSSIFLNFLGESTFWKMMLPPFSIKYSISNFEQNVIPLCHQGRINEFDLIVSIVIQTKFNYLLILDQRLFL